MKTGFEILREIMVEGYRPSVARLYDWDDAADHFSWLDGNCVLVFWRKYRKRLADATAEAIETIVAKYDGLEQVDSKVIEDWFNNLNWGVDKIIQEKKEILETHNIGFTTEVASNWEQIHDIYQACVERVRKEIPDITWIGGHASHCYVNGTNMYFVYYYDVVDCPPEEEINKYHHPINKIIVEETLNAALGPSPRVGKARAPWIKDKYGSSFYILKTLKMYRPEQHYERRKCYTRRIFNRRRLII